jgi:hypothetical protein
MRYAKPRYTLNSRAALVVCSVTALGALAACSAEDGPTVIVQPDNGAQALPSFEEFKQKSARTIEGRTIYIVEWDLALQNEQELRAYYDELARGSMPKGAVNKLGSGADDVWANWAQLNLSYCVSTDFGTNQNRAITEMAAATLGWLRVANVKFVYDATQNGSCNNTNTNVTFAVRPWSSGGACAFFPSGGGCVPRTLVMNFTDLDTNPFYDTNAPNMTTTGVFRHELGHILGLRHEHTRPEAGTCFEDNNWRALTPYDQSSVMHYPWCNGVLTSDLSLTANDGISGRALYGMPAAWYVAVGIR